MAQVTIELRELLKNGFKLFDFEYEFDDKATAKRLEQAVIDHYAFHEIGQETPDRFKHVFKTRWLRAMSYYNELHNTTLLQYNPLINHSMREALEQLKESDNTQTGEIDQTGQDNSTVQENRTHNTTGEQTTQTDQESHTDNTTSGNSTRTDDLTTKTDRNEVVSDYPQQSIAGGDYLSGERLDDTQTTNTGTVKTNDSTTATTDNTTNENSTTTDSREHTEDNKTSAGSERTEKTTSLGTSVGTENTHYERTIEGLTGKTYQELIRLERENIIRISGMLIEELKPCFILVY